VLEQLSVTLPKSDGGGGEPAKVLMLEFKHASPYFAATLPLHVRYGRSEAGRPTRTPCLTVTVPSG